MNQRIDGLTYQASLDILNNEIRNIIIEKRKKQKIDQLEQIINVTEQHVEKRFDSSCFVALKNIFIFN